MVDGKRVYLAEKTLKELQSELAENVQTMDESGKAKFELDGIVKPNPFVVSKEVVNATEAVGRNASSKQNTKKPVQDKEKGAR